MGAKQSSVDAVAASPSRPVLQRLESWVRGVLGDVPISLDHPGKDDPGSRGVGLYLLALGAGIGTRGNKAPALQFELQYLVTTWGGDAASRQDDLCSLAFSAMEMRDLELVLEPLPAGTWQAFGVAPRPSFVLRIPLRKERVVQVASPVREPLHVAARAMRTLRGVVLGPADTPIAGARVELPALARSAVSDHEGRFRFAGVPAATELRVRVRARGAVQDFESPASIAADGVLSMRMDL